MTGDITCYLLRTLPAKPTGLRVSLKIFKVKEGLETFDESDSPAATIMSHGLFLARPTPAGVRDPLLVAVLNQRELREDEPDSRFGVFWHARIVTPASKAEGDMRATVEKTLGKRLAKDESETETHNTAWTHSIALIRNGIIKVMPRSVFSDTAILNHFDSMGNDLCFQEFVTQNVPNVRIPELYHELPELDRNAQIFLCPTLPYPVVPGQFFVTIMQHFRKIHKDTLETAPSACSKIKPEVPSGGDNPQPGKSNTPVWRLYRTMEAVERMLTSLHTTLRHMKSLVPPKDPTNMKLYESVVTNTQKDLRNLAHLVLLLLLEPFSVTLAESSTRGISEFNWIPPNYCESLMKCKKMLWRLYHIGKQDFSKLHPSELEDDVIGILDNSAIPRLIGDCWSLPAFRARFFTGIEELLVMFDPDCKLAEQATAKLMKDHFLASGPIHLIKESYFTQDFVRVGDYFLNNTYDYNFCCLKSAKSTESIRLNPGLHTIEEWMLVAAITSQDTQVFIVTENLVLDEALYENDDWITTPDTVTFVKVFQRDIQVACFATKPTLLMGRSQGGHRTIQYFTGRFFIKLGYRYNHAYTEFFLIDLAPCLKPAAAPPLFYLRAMSEFVTETEHLVLEYAITNEFLSYIAIDPNNRDEAGKRIMKPTALGIINFCEMTRVQQINPIPCGHLFDEINEHLDDYSLYQNYAAVQKICWSTDFRRLYYTNWGYSEDLALQPNQTQNGVLIACFGVCKSLDSMQMIAFRDFQLSLLMETEVLKNSSPEFTTFRTRATEYLVLNIYKEPEWREGDSNLPQTILARVLFKVHRRRIHMIPVNGQLVTPLPFHIGNQVRYAGYDTCHMSLFHHRRVFSDDKVVTNLYRLDYRPL